MLQVNVEGGLAVAKGINEFGIMVVMSAFLLILSVVVIWTIIRRYMKITDRSINGQNESMQELIQISKLQNEKLEDIREGLSERTISQTKVIVESMLESDTEKTLRLLRSVRKENNIHDIPAVTEKVTRLMRNLSNRRYEALSQFTFHGRPLSVIIEDGWHKRVVDAMLKDLMMEENNGRAYTNISAIYEDILNNFYRAMKR